MRGTAGHVNINAIWAAKHESPEHCSFDKRWKKTVKTNFKVDLFKITLSLQSQAFQAPNNYFSISLLSEKVLCAKNGTFFYIYLGETQKQCFLSDSFC